MPTSQFGQHVLALAKTAYDSLGAVSDSLAHILHRLEEHTHSAGHVYPTGASGVTLTCGSASAWDMGAIVEIIPASTVTSPFDLHWVSPEEGSEDTTYEIVLYKGGAGSEVEITRFRMTRDAVEHGELVTPRPIMSAVVDANERISGAVMSATGNADTITLSLEYHTY